MAIHRIDSSSVARLLGNWTQRDLPLSTSLAGSLRKLIVGGWIAQGSFLPSQRELARTLGISRGTLNVAYHLLESEGYLVTQQGSGTRVRLGKTFHRIPSDGRLFSLGNSSKNTTDLSTGALPSSRIARKILSKGLGSHIEPYLLTDGYFPEGIPSLRESIARTLTDDGLPTAADNILVTTGAQQATNLVFSTFTSPGDRVLTENPTYRGSLEVFRRQGLRTDTVVNHTVTTERHLETKKLTQSAQALYVQTGINNPTGLSLSSHMRSQLAHRAGQTTMLIVEDVCSYDLTFDATPTQTLANLLPAHQVVMIGTLSKLFWGGLRVGWIRSSAERITQLTQMRKQIDISTSIHDQLYAVEFLRHVNPARKERADMLSLAFQTTTDMITSYFPQWTWITPAGGTGLWVDTGRDTAAFAARALQLNIKLAPGASFSPLGENSTYLRFPLWHEAEVLETAFRKLQTI